MRVFLFFFLKGFGKYVFVGRSEREKRARSRDQEIFEKVGVIFKY